MFKDFETCKNWIENIKKFGSKLDLSRITEVLEILGNPQNTFPSIHIAGTNGKGSTASNIKSILVEAGFNVGLFTSPYVVKFNERIAINNRYILDEDVLRYVNQIYPIWNEFNDKENTITFFEMLTIICFLYFRDEKVDYAVIEVGLGGKLDATNVIIPVVSVITNISYDHMSVLGDSLESIAMNKLGIVKEGVPLITTVEKQELFPLFEEVCIGLHSELTIIDTSTITDIELSEVTMFNYKDECYELGLVGLHQAKNAALAIETVRKLAQIENLSLSEDMMKEGLKNTKWPGRFEIIKGNIILDGAHNIGGIIALSQTVKRMFKDKRIITLTSIMHDKEHKKMIETIDDFSDEVYFTQFDYARRADAVELYQESNSLNKHILLDYNEKLSELMDLKENEVLVITGSLYFISDIRAKILE